MEIWMKRGQAEGALPGLPAYLSELLMARGIDTKEKARAFLHPELSMLHDPFLMGGMMEAVRLIEQAKEEGLRAVVYGDYDVDGICASAIMQEALTAFGLSAASYIPDRHEEGYGLNESAVRELSRRAGLLVTVDCGITGEKEIALARSLGMKVIVTDHHTLPQTLPEADAVVHPQLASYPFPSLCGAGVAYKVLEALLGKAAAEERLDLCALATVADMVPLVEENRVLVSFGLKTLERTRRPGLRALYRAAGLCPPFQSEHIAFFIAPRLNAGGRLESALTALTLLQTGDEDEAEKLALALNSLNEKRRALEKEVENDARAKLTEADLVEDAAIVLMGEGYESGVVGLAAGRIADAYGYPAVILSMQGEWAVGSARSAGDVDIYQALKACEPIFLRFGGHKQAAGMTLKADDVPKLRRRLSLAVKAQLGGRALAPVRRYDAELTLQDVNEETYARLSLLEPCGMGNPAPVFMAKGAEVMLARAVGAGGAHLKLTLAQANETRGAIAFSRGDMARSLSRSADFLFALSRNEFNGRVSYECRVTALRPDPLTVKNDKKSEQAALLQDFESMLQNTTQFPAQKMTETALAEAAKKPQGTLLLCRTRETARRVITRFPALDYFEGGVNDPRAYSAVAVAAPLAGVAAPFRRVILMDGEIAPCESALWTRALKKAEIFAMPVSEALNALFASITPSREELRALYQALRAAPQIGADALALKMGVEEGKAQACLDILQELRLIERAGETGRYTMLPMHKCDPASSLLYRSLQQRKEAH